MAALVIKSAEYILTAAESKRYGKICPAADLNPAPPETPLKKSDVINAYARRAPAITSDRFLSQIRRSIQPFFDASDEIISDGALSIL